SSGISTETGTEKTEENLNHVSENVTAVSDPQSVTVGLPDDAVTLLGSVKIANEGDEASGAKIISMSFADKLLVTDIHLLADTEQKNITVTYTLKDSCGEKVKIADTSEWTLEVLNTCFETSASGSELCVELNTGMLPENQQSYYFASISYSIASIAAQTSMYTTGSSASATCPGNYFGYLAESAEDGATYDTIVKITDPDGSETNEVSVSCQTKVTVVTCEIMTTCDFLTENESAETASNGEIMAGTAIYKTMTSADDATTYTLSFCNEKSGTATDLVYYIPVPKKNVTSDFVSEAEFDYTLADENSVAVASEKIGDDLNYTVYVTTERIETLDAASDSSVEWTDTGSYDGVWSEVTMVKVVVDSSIGSGQDLTITVTYAYGGDASGYASCAGDINTWCSMGTYTYIIGTAVNASVQTTGEKTTMLIYVDSANVEVTAKKNDTTGDCNTSTSSVNIGIGSGFSNVQNLTIASVTLQDADMKLEDIDAVQSTAKIRSSSTANTTFGLSLALNEGGTLDLSKVDLDEVSTVTLGEMSESEQNSLTLTLYNGDALTADTDLTVTLVLTGATTDGNTNEVEDVAFTINLTIKREKAGVTAETAIEAGKSYEIFSGDGSVTINQDSTFTAQFSLSYVPDEYDTKTLSFGNTLPEGTTLLLIEVPVDSDGKELTDKERTYYSYTATGSESSISLTSFQKLGASSPYYIPTGEDMVYEAILFIVDFSNCTQKPAAGTSYTIKLIQTGSSASSVSSPADGLTCTIFSSAADASAARSFTLNGPVTVDSAVYGTALSFSYGSSVTGASDAYYDGRKLAMVVSTKDGSTLPDDAYLIANGENYYCNSDGKFVIPLDTLHMNVDTGGSISVTLCSAAPTETTLIYTLWVSGTDDGSTPFMGDDTGQNIEVAYRVIAEPSFEVTSMSARLVTSTSGTLTVSYQYKDFIDCTVTMELQKKDGSYYKTSTNDMTKVTVGEETKLLQSGVVTLISSSASEEGEEIASFTLSEGLIGTATYRLLFKVCNASGEQVYEIPYNFIVSLD
ncbi:MAG: hypothetical protein LUH07_14775, partial [Lachnospiraceae bacterium]|nr:hypothetical protein [Lachnospiraceae bacterium]